MHGWPHHQNKGSLFGIREGKSLQIEGGRCYGGFKANIDKELGERNSGQ